MGTPAGEIHVALAGLIVQPVRITPAGSPEIAHVAARAAAVAAGPFAQLKVPAYGVPTCAASGSPLVAMTISEMGAGVTVVEPLAELLAALASMLDVAIDVLTGTLPLTGAGYVNPKKRLCPLTSAAGIPVKLTCPVITL